MYGASAIILPAKKKSVCSLRKNSRLPHAYWFAECIPSSTRQTTHCRCRTTFFLPRVDSTLGKVFAECPTKNIRQRVVCCLNLWRVTYTEGGTRVFLWLAKDKNPIVVLKDVRIFAEPNIPIQGCRSFKN